MIKGRPWAWLRADEVPRRSVFRKVRETLARQGATAEQVLPVAAGAFCFPGCACRHCPRRDLPNAQRPERRHRAWPICHAPLVRTAENGHHLRMIEHGAGARHLSVSFSAAAPALLRLGGGSAGAASWRRSIDCEPGAAAAAAVTHELAQLPPPSIAAHAAAATWLRAQVGSAPAVPMPVIVIVIVPNSNCRPTEVPMDRSEILLQKLLRTIIHCGTPVKARGNRFYDIVRQDSAQRRPVFWQQSDGIITHVGS